MHSTAGRCEPCLNRITFPNWSRSLSWGLGREFSLTDGMEVIVVFPVSIIGREISETHG